MSVMQGTVAQNVVEESKRASVEFAERIFVRQRVFGPRTIRAAIPNVDVPDTTTLPLTEIDLMRDYELGHTILFTPKGLTMTKICDLCNDKTLHNNPLFGGPDRFRYTHFFDAEELPEGWWSVSRVLPGSKGVNFVSQTDILAHHTDRMFCWSRSSVAESALSQFREQRGNIEAQDFEKLRLLQLNQIYRAPPVLLFWLAVVCERVNRGERFFETVGSWTNRIILPSELKNKHSTNWPVCIGGFDAKGIKMAAVDPLVGMANIGVCFARRL